MAIIELVDRDESAKHQDVPEKKADTSEESKKTVIENTSKS